MLRRTLSRRYFLSLFSGSLSFLSLMPLSLTVASTQNSTDHSEASAGNGKKPTIGIALGAGGANGLAHILMLEALDELSLRPDYISGSSIGAIIGALYAAGMSGKQIRGEVEKFFLSPNEELTEKLLNKDAIRWVEFLEIDLGDGGLLSSENFISFLYDLLKFETFEELEIPLKLTAADLWSHEQVILQSGPLLPAIKASMALPGVFEPEIYNNRVLVDGGTVNPVPYDLLYPECDIVIGIDVGGQRSAPETPGASYFETIFNSIKVMQQAIMDEKLKWKEPTIYLVPHILDIRALEFYRAHEVFKQAYPAKRELKKQLVELLNVQA